MPNFNLQELLSKARAVAESLQDFAIVYKQDTVLTQQLMEARDTIVSLTQYLEPTCIHGVSFTAECPACILDMPTES